MYNHTGLQGRLTADPELRHTPSGVAITSFRLASDTGPVSYTHLDVYKRQCVGCGLYWNVSIYQQIPRGGYICPHCESRLRAGETLPNQRPGQNLSLIHI